MAKGTSGALDDDIDGSGPIQGVPNQGGPNEGHTNSSWLDIIFGRHSLLCFLIIGFIALSVLATFLGTMALLTVNRDLDSVNLLSSTFSITYYHKSNTILRNITEAVPENATSCLDILAKPFVVFPGARVKPFKKEFQESVFDNSTESTILTKPFVVFPGARIRAFKAEPQISNNTSHD